MSGTPRFARRLGGLAAVAAIVTAVGVPLTASASSSSRSLSARSASATGVMFGGVTPQGWPVLIELNKNRRRVVQAVVGITLPCRSGEFWFYQDPYDDLALNRKRRFSASFGPDTTRNDDGTTSDLEGSMSGRLNRARSKVSGTWRLKLTLYDNAGAVTETCDSGTVRWSAKQ